MRFALRAAPSLAALSLVGCAAPRNETSSSTQSIVCASDGAAIDARDVVDVRVDATLARTPWSARGNHHPLARFVMRRGSQSFDLDNALAAILVDGGAAIVRADGALERLDSRGCSQVIARDVLPDLTASLDGRTIAFDQSFGDGTALSIHRDGATRRLRGSRRPLFVDAETLLFVGAERPGSTFHRMSLHDLGGGS